MASCDKRGSLITASRRVLCSEIMFIATGLLGTNNSSAVQDVADSLPVSFVPTGLLGQSDSLLEAGMSEIQPVRVEENGR